MKLGPIWKMVQYNLMVQAGIPVTPEQLGIKNTTGLNGSFNQVLNGVNIGTMPTPPTPPTDLQNQADVARYNQEMLTYNQNFQQYQMKLMQQMNLRFQQMQQSIQQAARTSSSSSSNSSSLSSSERVGVGGILDSVSDINNV